MSVLKFLSGTTCSVLLVYDVLPAAVKRLYLMSLKSSGDSTYFYKFRILGEEQRCNGNSVSAGEVGWYILGANQQHVGPYASLELVGKLQGIAENWKSCSFIWKSVLVFFLFDLKGNLLKLNDLDYFEC